MRARMTQRKSRRQRKPPRRRSTYRHGDLRRALLEAGITLARAGGPDAVVLREATRRVGVVPNAAYRHFANRLALLQAVRMAALAQLARAIEAKLDAVSAGLRPAEEARATLRAVGLGYLAFAFTETGLYRTIFWGTAEWPLTPDPARSGASGLTPFELLAAALDRMVAAGVLAAERRPGAEFLAWSTVHGFAMLVIDGPLHGLARAQADALGARAVAMVEQGL